jgi:hypothetical protein
MNWIAIGLFLLVAQPVLWIGVIVLWRHAVRTRERLEWLEMEFARRPWVAPVEAPLPEPVRLTVPEPPPLPLPAPVEALLPEPEPEPEPAPAVVAETPRPERNWEAILGGNWLNKAGVLLLVIGVALLLRYSFNHLEAIGRVAMGAAIGSAMLAGGIWSERRPAYRLFGHGLVGGGWAALYFTAFAAHALPAARVIESAAVGSALLAVVAIAMIADSLRYRSQTVTALAYFLGFLTLGISELSGFALAASVPLAGSLLFLARRFGWRMMARAAAPVAYLLFVVHAAQSHGGDPRVAQALVLVYWLLFEIHELTGEADLPMLALNAVSFLPCSYLIWGGRGHEVWLAPAIAAGVYGCSAMVRSVRRAGTYGYQATAALASALGAVAILSKLSGFSAASALLIEGEALWVMGMAFRQKYLRVLGAAVLGVWAIHFLAVDLANPTVSNVAMHNWHIWTPMAVAAGAIFLANRILEPAERFYSYAAAALAALVIGVEVAPAWVGVSWLVAAGVAHEIGARKSMPDFVHHAAGFGALAIVAFGCVNVYDRPHEWAPQLVGTVLLLAGTARSTGKAAQVVGAAASAALGCSYLLTVLPDPLVAVAWTAYAVALMEVAPLTGITAFATAANGVAMAAFGRLLFTNLRLTATSAGISQRLLTVAPIAAAQYWLFARSSSRFRRVYLYTAAVALALLLRAETAHVFRPVAWAAGMLAYLWAGRRFGLWDLRVQAYGLGCAAVVRFFAANPDQPYVALAGAGVAAALFAAHFLAPRDSESAVDRVAAHVLVVLGALTVAQVLWEKVSGGMLTMAWGLEGLALLAGGFAARGRTLRFTGLAALAVCVLKLFFYDLRNLETPYRIASFLVLGALLIAVSWAYTRFRSELERYL